MNLYPVFIPPPALTVYQRLPKCNLHSHLEGSIRPQTFLELALMQNIPLPFDPTHVEKYFQVTGEEQNLTDYLHKIMVNYLILKDREALRRAAFEAAEDAHFDGVVYFELRAGPVNHVTSSFSVADCIESMLTGLQQAEAKYGIICRLILSGLRDHRPDANLDLARLAVRYADQGVVGFDLAGNENGFPAALHRAAFHSLRDSGLGITVHAGEAAGWKSVYYAVIEIGAQRIGHGVRSIESHEMMNILRDYQVLLEICPTSNVHTGTFPDIQTHPVKTLHDFGIPISIGDDDPITSRTRVSNELTLLEGTFGFTLEDIIAIQLTSLKHSFLRESDLKTRLRQEIDAYRP
ncbi:MAG: adenosine deaminase [Chloroflexi bacterium 44-23]|nr:MAG: adenosine deaminase [Chloroflexi bacterium 44-23]